MSLSESLKTVLRNWLNITPAQPQTINIIEPFSYEANVMRNELWYRGDPAELHQFYTQFDDLVGKTSFWAAIASTGIHFRKVHSGVPSLIVDKLVQIVTNDLNSIKLKNAENQITWEQIAKDNDFNNLLQSALTDLLVAGDGAFKLSHDSTLSKMPIIEFFSGADVRYEYDRGRLQAIVFISDYRVKGAIYIFEEWYTMDGIHYKLYDEQGKEHNLETVPELAEFETVEHGKNNRFFMAIPMRFERSAKWPTRGKSIFETKVGAFDMLDESISQWVETMRDCRTTKYIPELKAPKNPNNGNTLKPNAFDNRYVQTAASEHEDVENTIQVVTPIMQAEQLGLTYITILDNCLQGLISPSTLGIDVKKLDNAESQREKEKTTLYTRDKIIDILNHTIPQLIDVALKTLDAVNDRAPGQYEATLTFGEYANPSFEAMIETISKAKVALIMSTETCIEELYGDTKTEEWKATEVQRLKDEAGVVAMDDMTLDEPLGGAE